MAALSASTGMVGYVGADRSRETRPVLSARSASLRAGASFVRVVLVFLVAAGIWVLAWVVLIVVALVRILFPIPDEDYDRERKLPREGPAR